MRLRSCSGVAAAPNAAIAAHEPALMVPTGCTLVSPVSGVALALSPRRGDRSKAWLPSGDLGQAVDEAGLVVRDGESAAELDLGGQRADIDTAAEMDEMALARREVTDAIRVIEPGPFALHEVERVQDLGGDSQGLDFGGGSHG
jgi:hypothetical protein